jgi:hypothetical protein
VCSACAGDYEDPDRTSWQEDLPEGEELSGPSGRQNREPSDSRGREPADQGKRSSVENHTGVCSPVNGGENHDRGATEVNEKVRSGEDAHAVGRGAPGDVAGRPV